MDLFDLKSLGPLELLTKQFLLAYMVESSLDECWWYNVLYIAITRSNLPPLDMLKCIACFKLDIHRKSVCVLRVLNFTHYVLVRSNIWTFHIGDVWHINLYKKSVDLRSSISHFACFMCYVFNFKLSCMALHFAPWLNLVNVSCVLNIQYISKPDAKSYLTHISNWCIYLLCFESIYFFLYDRLCH